MFTPFLLPLGALILVGYRYRRVLLRHSNRGLPRPASSNVQPSGLRLSWESEGLNPFHDGLVALFATKGPACQLASAFYNVGACLGVAGVVASVAVLAWECILLFKAAQRPSATSALFRRTLSEEVNTLESEVGFLKPLIPGVTIPLSELPLLIMALLASQAFHELGHIVSSALPPAAASLSGVGIALQGAFVSLLPHPDEAKHPWARVRNAAAGAWHNVVTWLALWATCQVGLHTAVRALFWRDVLPEGLAIISVHRASPLRDHLEPGGILVTLDDTRLHTLAAWEDYLLARPPYAPVELGWCVDSATFLSQPTNCDIHPGTTLFAPFPLPSFADPSQHHCSDPLTIFRDARCTSSSDCTSPSHSCIAPVESTLLLRLQVQEADHGHAIVWKGPRREVFEQVLVGKYVPRVPLVPVWALPTLEAFFEYLRSLTLALALLNLLPLRPLDGGVLLTGVLDILFGRVREEQADVRVRDIELGRSTDTRRPRRVISVNPALIARWVHNLVAILGLFAIACSLRVWTVGGH